MENKTNSIVTTICDSIKGLEGHLEDKIKGIKDNYQAEETRLNNVIEGLEKQLKTKYDSDRFVLVERGELIRICSKLEDVSCEASSLESEIVDMEYSEVSSICSLLQDASYSASSLNEQGEDILGMVEELLKEEEKPMRKPPAKKITAKKQTTEEVLDTIFNADSK